MTQKPQNKILCIEELSIRDIRPNPESIKKVDAGGSKLLIIGRPGSGKSVLVKDLLYKFNPLIPIAAVVSGSEETNNFYRTFIPYSMIYPDYTSSIIEGYKTRQTLAKKHFRPGCGDSWGVLVMDDFASDVKQFLNPTVIELFKLGRHWNLLTIFATQYVFDFKPELRNQIEGVFIFREPCEATREKIYKNFASVIPKEYFGQIMDELTTDNRCLFISNQTTSNVWTDNVFFYKAEPDEIPNDFVFGCQEYIDTCNDRVDPEFRLVVRDKSTTVDRVDEQQPATTTASTTVSMTGSRIVNVGDNAFTSLKRKRSATDDEDDSFESYKRRRQDGDDDDNSDRSHSR